MPHRTALLGVTLLVALGACASNSSPRRDTVGLPEVPGQGLGVGLDELDRQQTESETRLADPEPPTLPQVPGGTSATSRSLEDWARHAGSTVITDLDPILDAQRAVRPSRPLTEIPTPVAETEETAPTKDGLNPLVGGPTDVFATTEPEPEAETVAIDTTQDLATLLASLERMTGDEALASGLPLGPALRAAALEVMSPGALDRALGALDDDSPFTPDERALLRAWADLHREVKLADADPMAIARLLREAADEAGALLPMHIKRLELCRAVNGYGSFTPLFRQDDTVMIGAGTARRMIVYAEIDRFSASPTVNASVDGFEVDLRQTLELVHLDKGDGGADLIAWSHPEERITDFSRNRRRDFYTVQIIELPATLTIGRYHLRLTVTDAHSDEEAQAIVPIDVVALTDLSSDG